MISTEQKRRLQTMWKSWPEVERALTTMDEDGLYDGFQGLEGPPEKGEFDAMVGVQFGEW